MFAEMAEDGERIKYFAQKEGTRYLKEVMRGNASGTAMGYRLYEAQRTRNRYLIWFNPEKMLRQRVSKDAVGAALLVNQDDGGRMVACMHKRREMSGRVLVAQDCLDIITPHFLSRYRERIGGDIALNDPLSLIASFCGRNMSYVIAMPLDIINRNHGKYTDGAAYQVTDGIVFVSTKTVTGVDGRPLTVSRWNTFLSYRDLKEDQRDNIFPDIDVDLFMSAQRALYDSIQSRK